MLVTGNNNENFFAITVLIFWNIFMFGVIKVAYKILRRKFEGFGV